jgi:hypothetical protein
VEDKKYNTPKLMEDSKCNILKETHRLGATTYVHNPSYSGGTKQDCQLMPVKAQR